MNKGDFVGSMLVQPLDGDQVMTLGGTPDEWVCTWNENGKTVSRIFNPEDLVPAGTRGNQKR